MIWHISPFTTLLGDLGLISSHLCPGIIFKGLNIKYLNLWSIKIFGMQGRKLLLGG